MFLTTLIMGFVAMFVPAPTGGYIVIGFICIFLIGNDIGVGTIVFFIFYELFDKDVALLSASILYPILTFVSASTAIIIFQLLPFVGLAGLFFISAGLVLIIGPIEMIWLPETWKVK